MSKKNIFVAQSYELLKKEIESLKKEIESLKKEISLARLEGDMSENSQFLFSEEELFQKSQKMIKLKELLENCKVKDMPSSFRSSIELGSTIKLSVVNPLINEKKELILMITDPFLANPEENKISINSPLINSLMEKKIGDVVKINGNLIQVLEIK